MFLYKEMPYCHYF